MKVIKKLIYVGFIGLLISSCNSNKKGIRLDVVDSAVFNIPAIDTMGVTLTNDARVFEVSRELNLAKDSIDILRDSIDRITLKFTKVVKTRDSLAIINISTREKLGTAEYKLLRIREYNRIAAKGNNLKFLRGWINRVINK